jgi:hypothetical protein
LNTKRNDPCSCDSGKKFKHCCIDLYNKRQRWNNLEETIRSIVEGTFEKYSNRKFVADALATFDNDVDFEDISDRRLFFDWLIRDYEIKDDNYTKSNITIIQKSLENLKNEHSIVDDHKKEKEKETLEMWTHTAFRFYEVVDIKKGHGYTVIDVFDNPDTNKHLFLFDHSSSFTINKHDIIYTRLYNVGEILRPAGGIINCPRYFLPFIKDYIIHSSQKYYNSKDKTNIKSEKKESISTNKEKPQLNEYFRKESVSIIKYLDSLNSDDNTSPVLTTAQGDPATLSRSSFLVIKSIRKFLSILDSSEEFVELENEGSTTLRYDWVEKLDVNSSLLGSSTYVPSSIYSSINKDVDKDHDKNNSPPQQNLGTVHPSEELSLHTILWIPANEDQDEEEEEEEKYDKTRSRKNNTSRFIPYRVLGNLDITGKTLFIECLSDSLLFRCNNLLESIAGKYLRHMGNTFMEIPSTTSKAPREQHSNMISREYPDSYKYDEEEDVEEDDYIDKKVQYDIENTLINMLREHYDNWITTKNPFLNNKTPLQAARTKEGKESLKELLEVMENDFYRRKNKSAIEDLPSLPFEKIKKKLGLK